MRTELTNLSETLFCIGVYYLCIGFQRALYEEAPQKAYSSMDQSYPFRASTSTASSSKPWALPIHTANS